MEAITFQSSAVVLDPDTDLAERHRRGDARAFDEVYSRYSSMVYNLAWRMSGDRDQAADLTQDVFLRIYRHLGSFRGHSSLKTWVYRVGLNQCRSRLGRKRPIEQPLAEEGAEGVEPLPDTQRGPEEIAMAGETAERVATALAGLHLAFREAVVLRDLQGMEYEEIAVLLGVPIGTVRSRIARGREALRVALEENA
ncbi:MAG: sigma-70 family RNA polymerase sigma factor [Acidobacteriota bacterium]